MVSYSQLQDFYETQYTPHCSQGLGDPAGGEGLTAVAKLGCLNRAAALHGVFIQTTYP